MRRTILLQEVRQMRFKEMYGGWKFGRLTQEEAGMEPLLDKRISQVSSRNARVVEVLALADR